MRIAAQSIIVAFCCVLAFSFLDASPVFAQTIPQTSSSVSNYYTNTDSNVPQNHHTFTEVALIDVMSAAMCQMTGIDPTNPSQPCLGVDPATGKIGFASQQQQFGSATTPPQPGGALGIMTQYVSSLYVPAVSSTQYAGYLAANFGIVKPTYAATATNCNNSNFGYGFCGLNPLLKLWADVRDLAYAFLTILFIAIGIGVMLRFRVDPRTVMTLQNQIPRVIIAIILITFSFAIAGAMIDLMWTVTYAGVNFISTASPQSKVALCPAAPKAINQVVETRLADQPISFTNTLFRASCKGTVIDSGLLSLADNVSSSLGDLVQQLIHDLLLNDGNVCHIDWWNPIAAIGGAAKCALQSGAQDVILWITEQLVKLIIVIALLIALFRLWLKLLQCYLTFLIFVILGPIWIVLGLIPGRPMGFEKWLRIIFANLAVFPLVAFILVFARIITDIVPSGPSTPSTVFIPPLVGNPSISTFSDLMGFGAILIAPNIPDIVKERMKSKSQNNLGAVAAAGFGVAATAFAAPGSKAWSSLNRRNPTTGAPEGALAIQKAKIARSIPGIRRVVSASDRNKRNASAAYHGYAGADWADVGWGFGRGRGGPQGGSGSAGQPQGGGSPSGSGGGATSPAGSGTRHQTQAPRGKTARSGSGRTTPAGSTATQQTSGAPAGKATVQSVTKHVVQNVSTTVKNTPTTVKNIGSRDDETSPTGRRRWYGGMGKAKKGGGNNDGSDTT